MRSQIKKGFLESIKQGLEQIKDDAVPLGILILREDDHVTFMTAEMIGDDLPAHPEVLDVIIDLFELMKADAKSPGSFIRTTEIPLRNDKEPS